MTSREIPIQHGQQDHLEVISHSPAFTGQIGMQLGGLLRPGDVICLSGDLGAGKTALAAGIGRGWGAQEAVNSPTFVIVHEHRRPVDKLRLYHLDGYRFASLEDALSAGLEDILNGEGILMVEWPERILPLLPHERLWIEIDIPDSDSEETRTRQLTFKAHGQRYTDLLSALRAALAQK